MTPLRALVADDEPLARETVRLLLAPSGDVDLVWEAADGHAAVDAIRAHRPDIVFLDVQMPGLDGFAVIEAVGAEAMPVTVFATAYDRFALRAFEVAAVDYLVKPYDDARFALSLARAAALARGRQSDVLSAGFRRLLDVLTGRADADPPGRGAHEPRGADGGGAASVPSAPAPGTARAPAPVDRFLVREGTRRVVVAAAEVDFVEAAGDYAVLHVGVRRHTVRATLSDLERDLGPAFVRVHRSALVHVVRVRDLRATPSGDAIVRLAGGGEVRASRRYVPDLEARLGGLR